MNEKQILESLTSLPIDSPAAKAIMELAQTEVDLCVESVHVCQVGSEQLQYNAGKLNQACVWRDTLWSTLLKAHGQNPDIRKIPRTSEEK